MTDAVYYYRRDMDRAFRSWIRRYEAARTDPYDDIKGWLSSSRFQLEGLSWNEIREIPINGLWHGATLGTCFEALRKTWYSYKRNKKDGFPAPDLELRILKLQKALGLPLSSFPEMDRYGEGWVDSSLREEKEEDDEW